MWCDGWLKHYKASSIATRSSIESVSTVETFGFFFGGAERGGAERGGAEILASRFWIWLILGANRFSSLERAALGSSAL